MKKLLILSMVIFLSGCGSEVATSDYTSVIRKDKDLDGCIIKYARDGMNGIYIARCPNSITTTTFSVGKTKRSVVTIEENAVILTDEEIRAKAMEKLTPEERKVLGLF